MPIESVSDLEQRLENLDNGNICENLVPYREVIDCLTYLKVGTHPDIAFAVRKLSNFFERLLE